MVGSIDYLDFCIEPIPEKNTIPLHCWQAISLSDIWIPSNLLASREKGSKTGDTPIIFHTLKKKDTAKYSESFSIYTDSFIEDEKEDIFLSDSDEDIFDSAPVEFEETKSQSDSLTLDSNNFAKHFAESSKNSVKKYFEHVTTKAPSKKNDDNLYSKSSVVNNLYNFVEQKNPEKSHRVSSKDDSPFNPRVEEIGFNVSHSGSASKEKIPEQFKNNPTQKRVNTDSDSQVSLNELINDAPVASLKDFTCNFEYKKKDSNYSSFCDQQKSSSKKSRKEKKGKKFEKCIPLDSLFEDMNATQEFNCNKYMNNVIKERERYARIGDNPLVSKEEYPDLTPEELQMIHSDSMARAENVKRQKYDRISDDPLCSRENLDLTPEELMFINSANKVKEENIEYAPTFSFVLSDKTTNRPLVPDWENDLNTNDETVEEPSDFLCKKIIIENIPHDVSKDDISSILCGYGEIRNFSMISTGKCLKVFVEIDLTCDIDWVIECLNGSEPFGSSTGVLKCYQQTE